MPAPGAKPKEDRSQVVGRQRVHEFTEIPNVPFEDAPPLRKRALGGVSVMAVGAANSEDWPPATLEWWNDVSRMPHAKLWTPSDWRYVMDTAEVHARTMEGWKGYAGGELRQREKLLGMTMDARRDLRIKYVPPPTEDPSGDHDADVLRLADYRDL
jgi:hypothetical protein